MNNAQPTTELAEAMEAALERADLALADWLHHYAPELCHKDDVARTRSRIANQGGTITYISDVAQEVRTAIKLLKEFQDAQ